VALTMDTLTPTARELLTASIVAANLIVWLAIIPLQVIA